MAGVEEARQQVIAYEQGSAETQAVLQAFETENEDKLASIQSEFEDYTKHPLWQEYAEKKAATARPDTEYRQWHRDETESIGWEREVLFQGVAKSPYDYLNKENPNRSPLPLTVEEFERRVAISEHIGQVATMLSGHRGEPIVSLASYQGGLKFKKQDGAKQKSGFTRYRYGRIDQIAKTRVIVGTINQPGNEPVLATQTAPKEDSRDLGLRLTLAGNIAGIISGYSLSLSKKQLKHQTSLPHYSYRSAFSDKLKSRTLPLGNSLIGNASLAQLRSHDMVVIDGPHRTAADHEFSDDILLHRPKQKIETDTTSRDQEVAVTSGPNAELFKAIVRSEDQEEVALPSLRHDTIWLVGTKAIDAYLADTIRGLTSSVSQRRGTDEAVLRATRDLVKFASNGRSVAELTA